LKKYLLGFLFIAAIIENVSAFEWENGRSQFSLGLEISSYKYKEPNLMSLSGTKYGLSGQWVYRINREKSFFSCCQFRFMKGNSEYDGGIGNKSDGTYIKIVADCPIDQYYEYRALFGYAFTPKNNKIENMPYLGLALRYLFNRLGTGYDRTQYYVYIPAGSNIKLNFHQKNIYFLFNVEFDLLLKGYHIMEGIVLTTDDYIYRRRNLFIQNTGYGLRISGKVSKKIDTKTSIFIEPFIRYWDIAASDIVNGFLEPKNNTVEYGAKIGLSF